MPGSLDGRRVLITGASSGIGEATALAIVAEGGAVALGARRKDRLDSLVERIGSEGGTAMALEADVSDEEQAKALVDDAERGARRPRRARQQRRGDAARAAPGRGPDRSGGR